jgi:hypothetical protein
MPTRSSKEIEEWLISVARANEKPFAGSGGYPTDATTLCWNADNVGEMMTTVRECLIRLHNGKQVYLQCHDGQNFVAWNPDLDQNKFFNDFRLLAKEPHA